MSLAREGTAATPPGDAQLTVRVEPDGTGGVVVVLVGEVDLDCATDVRDVLISALRSSPRVTVDLAAVTFCDCAVLNALLRARLEAMEAGGDRVLRFRIHGMSVQMARLLDLTDTRQYFPDTAGQDTAGPPDDGLDGDGPAGDGPGRAAATEGGVHDRP
ncbi:STAS domain-containing protein [Streptomyces goshikiensis]|uniref:STAS domain-containing protein n=1 Tax=Streptomyces goshikiensis TaxID=1942 RepID=UPI003647F26C